MHSRVFGTAPVTVSAAVYFASREKLPVPKRSARGVVVMYSGAQAPTYNAMRFRMGQLLHDRVVRPTRDLPHSGR